MKLRVYMDTSVFSAYCDDRTPERMAETAEFWDRRGEFELSTSEIARIEIEQTRTPGRKAEMLALLSETREIGITEEARELAKQYVAHGIFTLAMRNDALHLAVAVLDRQDILVSWNYKHLVNRRTRAEVYEVNARMALPMIEILAPSEL